MTSSTTPDVSLAGAAGPPRAGWMLAALLGATFLGTVSNNIVNVPLRQITDDLTAPVTQGVLIASASVLVLAVAMPLTGWITDRLGRRRTLVIALSVLLAGTIGAAVSPDLPTLVVSRAVQGLGCAAVPTAVMGTLARYWPAQRRGRVMGAWGTANGIGQAVGPPVGGVLADALGWRSIFWLLVPATVLVLILAARFVPHDRSQTAPIDGVGAGSLTVGVAALMTAITVAPQAAVPGWIAVVAAVVGALSLIVFAAAGMRRPAPFIDPRLLLERNWLRSAAGVFVQQVTLFAVLVAVPLHLTGEIGLSTTVTGLLIFALPLVWAFLAPLVGRLSDRVGPLPVLRTGLSTLLAVDVGFAVLLGTGWQRLVPVVALLVLAGAGVALVQTPSLTGATRSAAGQLGAGLGLFNMMRFVGASVGAAGVAAAYPGRLGWLFLGCAAVGLVGLVLSFTGRAGVGTPAASRPPPVRAG